MRDVRVDLSAGRVPPSFGKYLLKNQAELELLDDEIAHLASPMFGAGVDTAYFSASLNTITY